MVSNQTRFSGFFQHPHEPLFLPKNNGALFYDVPDSYYTDRYRGIGPNLANRFGENAGTRIPIMDIGTPDISFAMAVRRREGFSLFNRTHRAIAGQLIERFMSQPDVDTLASFAAFSRDRLNAPLFQYALGVALLHRRDTRDVAVPSFLQLFPDRFVDPAVFPRLREEGMVVEQGNRMAIDIPMNFTALDREPEQRLAYFREDIGVNLHHWHWHLVYPGMGPREVVDKDRRGELFYYMHGQLVARYHLERFCNGLGRVAPLNNLRQPIREPYYPKILRSANNRTHPARYRNMVLSDVVRPDDDVNITLADMELQLRRIVEAIDTGFALSANGDRIPLDNPRGIDVLGNIVESCLLTPNETYYGDVHNSGHIVLSYIHDPDGTYLESYGVMGDVTTAMRDPIFYRWHEYVDEIFRRHKNNFSPYVYQDLSYHGITMLKLETRLEKRGAPNNLWLTFWQRSQVDLGAGLDFGPQGNVFATFTHLQHAPFVFQLQIVNADNRPRRGTVRIYLAPKFDERGVPLSFENQRRYIVELDTFRVRLNPGVNNIVRRSDQSSVTIPYERTFRNVAMSNEPTGSDQFRFCNCGWPSHMLIPKGTTNGTTYDLFAMVSDFTGDVVDVDFDESRDCDDAHSFCGIRDRLFPDARNMGYPFDRKVSSDVKSFIDFVAPFPNMSVSTVTIRFTNTVIART
ncbi:phenoloxidase subunit A3 [Culex quinquefasciatus]|uniref:Phenoloxidase subunit A3 n=1 Tax=Culex quinquefasciatus TaxID=7176 RepID=B0XCP1_CULQU|nr:phenoloxidase subunit A3 [Culex quinquefasciatus]|eukprot:XP_001867413.1 phenoloxidase subunit A3 [Culex quinquefasciatus]